MHPACMTYANKTSRTAGTSSPTTVHDVITLWCAANMTAVEKHQ